MLFFVVIIIYFSYLRKIIKIDNGATEGLVQQRFREIAGLGQLPKKLRFFKSCLVLGELSLKFVATSRSRGTLATIEPKTET